MDTLLLDALSEVGYVVGMTAQHHEETGGVVDFGGLMDDLETVVKRHLVRARALGEADSVGFENAQKAPEGA